MLKMVSSKRYKNVFHNKNITYFLLLRAFKISNHPRSKQITCGNIRKGEKKDQAQTLKRNAVKMGATLTTK